jgi:hypothetical protein
LNKLSLPIAFLLFLSPAAARAQVNIHIDLGLPPVPRLVVVQPGVQVVEGVDEEVFFHHGWYWCRRPNGWYRSRSPREHFGWVEGRHVPPGLTRMPAGHYRNWHQPERHEMRREERREERHEMKREERREDRREHRERKEERRDERRDDREHGRH